jgi:hypothetical protein
LLIAKVGDAHDLEWMLGGSELIWIQNTRSKIYTPFVFTEINMEPGSGRQQNPNRNKQEIAVQCHASSEQQRRDPPMRQSRLGSLRERWTTPSSPPPPKTAFHLVV